MLDVGDLMTEKNLVVSDGAFIWLLEITVNDVEVLRLAKNDEDVTFEGHTWQAWNFNTQSLRETSGENHAPRFRIGIQDYKGEAQKIIRRNNGIDGADMRLIRVNTEQLSSTSNKREVTGKIQGVSYDEEDSVAVDCVVSSLDGVTLPVRQFLPSCGHTFKDPETCQYAGSDATCSQQLLDSNGCKAKGNEANFGGYFYRLP